jgi:protein-tyrosine phosphatase
MKPEHELFIKGMVLHGDKRRAYREAYPEVSDESARTAANRLLRDPGVYNRIMEVSQRARQRALEELDDEAFEMAQQQLLTVREKRVALSEMVNGNYKRKRYIKLKDKVEVVYEDISVYAVLRAIELDSKLSGELTTSRAKEIEKDLKKQPIAGTYQIYIGGDRFDGEKKEQESPVEVTRESCENPMLHINWTAEDEADLLKAAPLNWPVEEIQLATASLKDKYELQMFKDDTFLRWLIKAPKTLDEGDSRWAGVLLAQLRRYDVVEQEMNIPTKPEQNGTKNIPQPISLPFKQDMKILMVCLGNICRSPIAEGLMRHKIKQHGLNWEVASAGTESYHIGEAPHQFSQNICQVKGVDISAQRAQKFTAADFAKYDKIYAMAGDVYEEIERIGGRKADMDKVEYFLNELEPASNGNVPDPWYGTEEGYATVYELIDRTCDAIIEKYKKH